MAPPPGDGAPLRRWRRRPQTIGGLLYLIVLAGTGGGLLLALAGEWRAGVRLVGLALVVAAISRAALRPEEAGMLGIRNRVVDAVMLAVVGLAMIVLASSIPSA